MMQRAGREFRPALRFGDVDFLNWGQYTEFKVILKKIKRLEMRFWLCLVC